MGERDEHFVYEPNNEEEAEIAQLSSLFETEALVRAARERMQKASSIPSRIECVECDEPISEQRQRAVPGVQLCIDCAQLRETRR
jgi:RNA polymerase-binding transcription factor DksA